MVSFSCFAAFLSSTLSDLDTKFSRERWWGPRSVFIAVALLTRGRRRTTYRSLLRDFVEQTRGALGWTRTPSLASLSQARRKLSMEDCRAVLLRISERLSRVTPGRFRHASGRRFIALDGVRFLARRTRETVKRFHTASASRWVHSHYPQALVVVAVDLMRRLPLDFALVPKGKGERIGAASLLTHFHPGDVAVLDRGFPARWLLKEFVQARVDVVMRMVAGRGAWKEAAIFVASKKTEQAVTITVAPGVTVAGRFIRRNARRGRPARGQHPETQIIFTTLPADQFSRDDIIQLYTARWGIETIFREMKCEFDVERFHAHTVDGIFQEIATVLAWIGFASAVQITAEARLNDGRRVLRTLCFDEATGLIHAALAGHDLEARWEKAITNLLLFPYRPKSGRSYPRERKSPIGRFRIRRAK